MHSYKDKLAKDTKVESSDQGTKRGDKRYSRTPDDFGIYRTFAFTYKLVLTNLKE